jgi:hypothetical protein
LWPWAGQFFLVGAFLSVVPYGAFAHAAVGLRALVFGSLAYLVPVFLALESLPAWIFGVAEGAECTLQVPVAFEARLARQRLSIWKSHRLSKWKKWAAKWPLLAQGQKTGQL